MNRLLWKRIGFPVSILLLVAAGTARSDSGNVYIGLNAEIGHATSTSDDAIRQGIQIAIEEINRSGGVLGGRKLELIVRDNRAVPARAAAHYKELAGTKDLVAVFCGKFSSAVIESLPLIHEKKLVLLDPWASNDMIVSNGYTPSYAFRLSLKDSWAVPEMIGYARKRGFSKVGVLLINTSWGRNNHEVVKRYLAANPGISAVDTQWFNYGDNTPDGAIPLYSEGWGERYCLRRHRAGRGDPGQGGGLPSPWRSAPHRQPLECGRGPLPGDDRQSAGEGRPRLRPRPSTSTTTRARGRQQLLAIANRLFNMKSFSEVTSPCGLAQSYDLARILAMAIEKAGCHRPMEGARRAGAGWAGTRG